MDRRRFLATAAGSLGALAVLPELAAGAEAKKVDPLSWTPSLLSAGGFETLILTWAANPARSMRLQWIQASAEIGSNPRPVDLTYRVKGKSVISKTTSKCHGFGSPGTRLWVHRVDLVDLQPNTLYEFQLGEETLFFKTAPLTLTDSLVFVEGGDIGTNEAVVSQLHRMVSGWDPLFAHVGGDLSYSNGISLDLEIKFLIQWRKYMLTDKKRLIPMVPGIGNHEVIGGYDKTPKEAPYFYALFNGLFPSNGAYGNFTMGDYLSLIMLDTNHTCPIEAQVPFLGAQLEASKNVPHVFVSYHIGAWPCVRDDKGKIPSSIREHWLPVIEKSKVGVVFEHHDHAFKKTVPLKGGLQAKDGILYLGDGDWGRETRKVKSKEERPYLDKVSSDFNVWKVTLKAKTQTFEAFNEKGNLLDRFEKSV